MVKAQTINLTGAKAVETTLPVKIFGAKTNSALMAQAVQVFLSNQRKAHARAKTRAQVDRTKAKWFRQKGTGRARHGARSAPIFVGGGKAHGPTGFENYKKSLSKKMRRSALVSSLSDKARSKDIIVLNGLNDVKKTKDIFKVLKEIASSGKKDLLLVLPEKLENIILAVRNISGLRLAQVGSLSAYEVLRAGKILFTKEAIKKLEDLWTKD